MDDTNQIQKTTSYLCFVIAGELFAMDVRNVIKIIEVDKFTKVPHSPDYFKGVANFGGGILPVIDTRLKFGFPKGENSTKTLVLVLNIFSPEDKAGGYLGITIDEAREVFEAVSPQIKAYPATGNKYKSDFITGVVERHNKFILLLDGDKLFTDEELGGIMNTNEPN